MEGYDLNIEIRDSKLTVSNNGSLRNLIANGIKYNTVPLIWNEYMNSVLKWSNISMKKYQNNPIFGCKSGTVSLQLTKLVLILKQQHAFQSLHKADCILQEVKTIVASSIREKGNSRNEQNGGYCRINPCSNRFIPQAEI